MRVVDLHRETWSLRGRVAHTFSVIDMRALTLARPELDVASVLQRLLRGDRRRRRARVLEHSAQRQLREARRQVRPGGGLLDANASCVGGFCAQTGPR